MQAFPPAPVPSFRRLSGCSSLWVFIKSLLPDFLSRRAQVLLHPTLQGWIQKQCAYQQHPQQRNCPNRLCCLCVGRHTGPFLERPFVHSQQRKILLQTQQPPVTLLLCQQKARALPHPRCLVWNPLRSQNWLTSYFAWSHYWFPRAHSEFLGPVLKSTLGCVCVALCLVGHPRAMSPSDKNTESIVIS